MTVVVEQVFEAAAEAYGGASDVESLVRPLLKALQAASGYESTYLTTIDWEKNTQSVVYSLNTGDLEIGEGLSADWNDTLCRRVLMGGPGSVENVADTYPDNAIVAALGLAGFASVPVTLANGTTVGTLCGTSRTDRAVDPATMDLFNVFSALIGAAMARETLLLEARERALAAEQVLRSRLESIAAAEHMLKTPLTALQGWAELLAFKGEALTADQRAGGIKAIGESAASLRELVDRLLAATRDDYRLQNELSLRMIDVQPLLSRIVTSHEAAAKAQTWHYTLGGPLFARVDLAGFEQLISHLLDNAIKYGGPGATVTVQTSVAADDAVTITIADTGPGLPDDLTLFQPFARSSSAERADSVGIGLHVVKSMVDAHGASIDFSANSPHGTVVTVAFPSP